MAAGCGGETPQPRLRLEPGRPAVGVRVLRQGFPACCEHTFVSLSMLQTFVSSLVCPSKRRVHLAAADRVCLPRRLSRFAFLWLNCKRSDNTRFLTAAIFGRTVDLRKRKHNPCARPAATCDATRRPMQLHGRVACMAHPCSRCTGRACFELFCRQNALYINIVCIAVI